MSIEYGLQMFSVRDITDKDLEGALRAVAEMGYRYVEYAGFFGHPAEEVAGWQEKYGLLCSGTHTGWGELLPENIEETIRYHKSLRYGSHPRIDIVYRPTRAAKVVFDYEIHDRDNNDLIATGHSVQAFVDTNYQLMLYSPDFYVEWQEKWKVFDK